MKITYGDHILKDEKLIKDIITIDSSAFYRKLENILLKLPSGKRNILFFIHGLWADAPSFSEPSGYILQQEVINQNESPYGLTISLQWNGTFNYKEDYDITKKAGEKYDQILQNLFNKIGRINPDYRAAYLIHSMGHHVFYHLIKQSEKSKCLITVNKVISCAGDISDTLFQDDTMYKVISYTDSSIIFYNNLDRTLKIAQTAVEGNRLGIVGPSNKNELGKNIKVKDLTELNDFESIPGSMSLHRYYYDSPTVRKIIREELSFK